MGQIGARKWCLPLISRLCVKMSMNHREKVFHFDYSPLINGQCLNSKLGGHALGGRVTAILVPTVSLQRYPPITGYSTSHSQHPQQTSVWSKRAYKGLNSNQIGTISINLYAYEPTFNAKGQPCIVDVSLFLIL